MNMFPFLNTSEVSEIPEATASMHPAFIAILVLVGIGFVIMIIQNFFIKKEEYYK
ncbi:MAG: hypothetical protein J6S15_07775 [Clostridia bacterium]|nr:hypothetical protein [Clostridia bacterium]MBO7157275.1 hypothetical protein [Clostridia bacterium]